MVILVQMFITNLCLVMLKETKDYVKYRMGKASKKFILGNYNISKLSNTDKEVNIHADFEVPDYSKKGCR
jgi:hypothetical protein